MYLIIIAIFLQFPKLQASVAAEPLTYQEGKTLTLSLGSGHKVKALGWQGQSLKTLDLDDKNIKLQRKGFGKLPSKLIVIPNNNKKSPRLLDIPTDLKKLKLRPQWEEISKDEVVIWGLTPLAMCTDHTVAKNYSSQIQLVLSDPRKTFSFSGAFWIKLSPKSSTSWLHFYNSHASIKKMKGLALEKADSKSRSFCRNHYGAQCDQVFNLKASSLGYHHEVKFSSLQKNAGPCPI